VAGKITTVFEVDWRSGVVLGGVLSSALAHFLLAFYINDFEFFVVIHHKLIPTTKRDVTCRWKIKIVV
jgi:hypothetical protein